jgi:hypothetical protein
MSRRSPALDAGVVLSLLLMFASAPHAASPNPPRALTAVVHGNNATLTWLSPSTGTPPLGYLVEASVSSGGPVIATFLVIEPSIVLNAIPDGVYYLRVRAGNAEGLSAPSNELALRIPTNGTPCASPPNAPTGLRASVVGTMVTVSWSAATGCAATGYLVQAGAAAGASDLAVLNAGASTSVSVSAPQGTYFVRVVAVNAFGVSVASNEIVVAVAGPLDLSGRWTGTSDYINAPFEFMLSQRGDIVSGTYQDQKDFGGVAGRITGTHILIDVNFGDTGIRFEGTIESDRRIRGTIRVPVLGRSFTFELTR